MKEACNAESFLVLGPFQIGGLLNAGTIDVRLYGPAGRGCEIDLVEYTASLKQESGAVVRDSRKV